MHATIRITDEEVEAIRSATANGDKHLPQWTLVILDAQDEVVATVLKTLYVRRNDSKGELNRNYRDARFDSRLLP